MASNTVSAQPGISTHPPLRVPEHNEASLSSGEEVIDSAVPDVNAFEEVVSVEPKPLAVRNVLDLSEPNFGRLRGLMIDMNLKGVTFETDNSGEMCAVFHLDDNAAHCELRVAGERLTYSYPPEIALQHWDASGGVIHYAQDWVILKKKFSEDILAPLRVAIENTESVDRDEKLQVFDTAVRQILNLIPAQPLSEPAPNGLPVKEYTVQSKDDVQLFVREVGGGDPDAETVLVLHGGPGCDTHYLMFTEELATSGRRIVTFHQRAAGLSTRPLPELFRVVDGKAGYDHSLQAVQEAFDLPRYVEDFRAVMNAAGGDGFKIIAQSWAGRPLDHMLKIDPQNITNVVYLGAVPPTSATRLNGVDDENWEQVTSHMPAPNDPHFAPIEQWAEVSASNQGALPFYLADPEDPRMVHDNYTSRADDGGLAAQALSNPAYDSTKTLQALEIPATVIAGRVDPFGQEWQEERAAAIGQGSVVYVEGGHNPQIESPEELKAAILNALAKKFSLDCA